jgi:small nuclear ribonucleoprotein G
MPPELKMWMEKKVTLLLSKKQAVKGIMRGFDHFLNIVLDQAVLEKDNTNLGTVIIRGQNIIAIQTT